MQGPGGNTRTVTMNLKADGSKLTGTVTGGRGGEAEISDGQVDGNDLSFSVVREFNGNKMTSSYRGKMDGDVIHFNMKMEGGAMGNMPSASSTPRRPASGLAGAKGIIKRCPSNVRSRLRNCSPRRLAP